MNWQQIANIVGAALILGLLLRWGDSASKLIASSSSGFSQVYHTVSLQGVQPPQG